MAEPMPDDVADLADPKRCPYCRCCTERLCHAACMKDTIGGESSSPGFDMPDCPCWREKPAARTHLTGAGG